MTRYYIKDCSNSQNPDPHQVVAEHDSNALAQWHCNILNIIDLFRRMEPKPNEPEQDTSKP